MPLAGRNLCERNDDLGLTQAAVVNGWIETNARTVRRKIVCMLSNWS